MLRPANPRVVCPTAVINGMDTGTMLKDIISKGKSSGDRRRSFPMISCCVSMTWGCSKTNWAHEFTSTPWTVQERGVSEARVITSMNANVSKSSDARLSCFGGAFRPEQQSDGKHNVKDGPWLCAREQSVSLPRAPLHRPATWQTRSGPTVAIMNTKISSRKPVVQWEGMTTDETWGKAS